MMAHTYRRSDLEGFGPPLSFRLETHQDQDRDQDQLAAGAETSSPQPFQFMQGSASTIEKGSPSMPSSAQTIVLDDEVAGGENEKVMQDDEDVEDFMDEI